MRCLRCVRTGAGRGSSQLLRPVRPAAPRAGERRNRGVGRRDRDRIQRHGFGRAGLRRKGLSRAARPHWDRPHSLLDDGFDGMGERPAGVPPGGNHRRGAGAQRKPHQYCRPRGAARRGSRHLGLDAHAGGDRPGGAGRALRRQGARARAARGSAHVRRGLHLGGDGSGQLGGSPRPPWLPAVVPR